MRPDLSMLRGEVLVEAGHLHAFSAATLPKAPAQRFAALFAQRPIWPAEDIPPYMAGLEVRTSTEMTLFHLLHQSDGQAWMHGGRFSAS